MASHTQHRRSSFSRRPISKQRKLILERLESRQLLAGDAGDASFFAGSNFLSNDDSDSLTPPRIEIDLPAQYDPVAKVIGPTLFEAHRVATAAMTSGTNNVADLVQSVANESGILVQSDQLVGIEIVANDDVESLRADLASSTIEFVERASFGKLISGSIDPLDLAALADLPSVHFVRPIYLPIHNAGSVTNEADRAMRTDIAKTSFGLDGAGIKIGVVSDSYDSTSGGGGAAGGIASGDLPGTGNPEGNTQPIQVLQDSNVQGVIDEGRAMLELIHDIVPKSQLAFHTSQGGPVAMANGILALASAGSDIIVDDVTYFAQPFFQDGVITQAANQVVSQGIPFFSSAGNQGRESYDSTFRSNGAQATIGTNTYIAHDFDPGPGVDNFQTVAVAAGRQAILSFQWDQPFASAGGIGSANDMDIFAFDQLGNIVAASVTANIGQDAVEVLRISNPTGQSQIFELLLGQNISAGGPQPGRVKYYGAGNPLTFDAFEFNTFSGTLFGHHQADGGAGIAAADYRDTPEFGTSPAQQQPSTSAGGVPILFDTAGNRLAQPIVRQQPILTGPDNTNTTFFSAGQDPDNDGNPNFAGTSAAAPHIAAVAALMMEAAGGAGSLSPAQINNVLSQTALDMGASGFDFDTGAGFVNAEAAIAAVAQGGGTSSEFYFSALIGGSQRELHFSDGTAGGTKLVENLAGSSSSSPSDFAMLNGTLLFSARLSDGQRELHRSRGTAGNTRVVKNLSGTASSDPQDLIFFNNRIIFSATLSDGQRELFESRGASANTNLIKNLSGARSANPKELTVVGNQLFFVATTASGDRELHVTDTTSGGTRLVKDLFGTHSARPTNLTAVNNKLYFTALLPDGQRELYVSTGSAASTVQVRNLGGTSSSNPLNLTAVGNRLFFTARLSNGERELHVTTGTAASTKMVKNIGGNRSANPEWLLERNNRLYFVATQPDGQRELMISNGTAASTKMVKNLSGNSSSNPSQLTLVGDQIVFTARQSNGERELYKSDGTSAGTTRIINLSGPRSSSPTELTAVGNQVVFSAALGSGQREVFISDLTEAGTSLVKNLFGASSSNPREFVEATTTSTFSFDSQFVDEVFRDAEPLDVSGDDEVSVLDALFVVNFLGRQSSSLGEQTSLLPPQDLNHDVNGDGVVSVLDALVIINHLNNQSSSVIDASFDSTRSDGGSDDEEPVDELLTSEFEILQPDL